MKSITDRDFLQTNFSAIDQWRIRTQTQEQFTYPEVDLVDWTMNLVDLRGDETVLEIGCGSGLYYDYIKEEYPEVKYYGLDYSPKMLSIHSSEHLVRSNLGQLPYPDHSFDVVMANHILFMAWDIDLAIEEMRRVMKPGGMIVTTTNSIHTMPQFRELFRRAILLVSPPGANRDVRVPSPTHFRYSLESGTRHLSRYFYFVVRHDLPGVLIYDRVEPIMEYLESTRILQEDQLPSNVKWDQVMLIMREQVNNLIMSLQHLVIDKLQGVLIATDEGHFAKDFVDIRLGRYVPPNKSGQLDTVEMEAIKVAEHELSELAEASREREERYLQEHSSDIDDTTLAKQVSPSPDETDPTL